MISRQANEAARDQEGIEDAGELFVVVAEWADQGPIVMETEGAWTSRDEAMKRAEKLMGTRTYLRVCIARLVYESGNALVLHDLKRMQRSTHYETPIKF